MGKDNIAGILHQTDIFSLVSEEVLQEIIPQVSTYSFKKDELIIKKDESGDKMFVIMSGNAKIHDGEHVLATVNSGSYFGEFFLFDSAPRSMSVSAMNDVEVIGINAEVFLKLLQKEPQIYNKIISLLIKRLRDQNSSTVNILKSREQELLRLVEERTLQLNIKSKELAEKNKEVTDSIVYAKRIQSAILPDVKKIEEVFLDSFVLYIPKDIVSGDFYTFFRENDLAIIVAADCTGHGVPGAFMSMIGSSLLRRIIIEKEITHPSKILDELHPSVVGSLRQMESESNDGMDIAVCSFNLKENVLQYAGANRPLWLVRGNEVQIISPDKLPIGGTQLKRENPFTNHSISLQKNDSIYIFTDGYADQFGGESGKKLMTAKFREVLLSIQSKNMKEQREFLNNYFRDWKGSHDQVDDVLVIGIKI